MKKPSKARAKPSKPRKAPKASPRAQPRPALPNEATLAALRAPYAAGKPAQALALAEAALKTYPNAGAVLSLIVACRAALGDVQGAETAARRVVELAPRDASAHANLGVVLRQRGELGEAATCLRAALALDADDAPARVQLGLTLLDQGALSHAEAELRQALRLAPADAAAMEGLARVLVAQRRHAEAEPLLLQLREAQPHSAARWDALGGLYLHLGRLSEAMACLERALNLDANLPSTWGHFGNALKLQGRGDEAEAAYRRAIALGNRAMFSNLLQCLNSRAEAAREMVFAEHRAAARALEVTVAPRWVPPTLTLEPSSAQRSLRIGLVSGDLYAHSVGHFLLPFCQRLDRQRHALILFHNSEYGDAVTEELRALSQGWVPCLRLTDDALAERIRAERIDLLIDLSGHTNGNRLAVFARRPAPVQLTWLGYPNTTGLSAIDYRVVDAITDPPGEADAYQSECLIRLPDGFLCLRALSATEDLPVAAPPALAGRGVTFGSFNNLSKIGPALLERWAAVLHAVPNARLLLKSAPIADAAAWDHALGKLAAAGIAPERVRVLPRAPERAEHLALYHQIDIALDTFPYNGTTTTVEALWMGVPVVSECGDHHAARVGASILTRLELPELIAEDADDYVRIAVELAQDPERLRRYRATLRSRLEASTLRDEVGFTRTFEWALREMWRIHCAGEESRVFDVPSQRDPNLTTPTQAAERALVDGEPGRPIALTTVGDAPSEPSLRQGFMNETHWTIEIADGVRVCVPPDVQRLTTFVLLEQEDWFEAELPFLRTLVEPGMGVLDIGANHGLYALSLAKRLNGQGQVIACEPASAPAAMLERSRSENDVGAVLRLLRVGLSDHAGEARLNINTNSELNSLSLVVGAGGGAETVRLTTLDWLMQVPEWPADWRVDVLKLDAEGEEIRILHGGQRFFAEQDPLVLFEWQHANEVNTGLLEAFTALGMDCYRLLPGLNALVPVAAGEMPDRYQLNLFACKPSRAARLRAAGRLLTVADAATEPTPPAQTWQAVLGQWPYVVALRPDGQMLAAWQRVERGADGHWPAYERALNLYLSAREPSASLTTRWGWLQGCRTLLDRLTANGDQHLATRMLRIRVLDTLGARAAAVEANVELVKWLDGHAQLRLDRPFVPPLADYDRRIPQGGVVAWLEAALREGLEVRRAHSVYFHRDSQFLAILGGNPNRSLAMDRRRALLALLAGQRVQLTVDSSLRGPQAHPGHRNVAWWQRLPMAGIDVQVAKTTAPVIPSAVPDPNDWPSRIRLAVSCRDADHLPRVPQAGEILTEGGVDVQIMHNGVRVLKDGYYNEHLTAIIREQKGVHEPQEEAVFAQVLAQIGPNSTMLELGAYWGYYSLWFASTVPGARNILVEPSPENLRVGMRNFELNHRQGVFYNAYVAEPAGRLAKTSTAAGAVLIPTFAVDAFLAAQQIERLNILHADIQGAELQMLQGARASLATHRIDYIFISTHSDRTLHGPCQDVLRSHGYEVLVEHSMAESYSYDGLIVAKAPQAPAIRPVAISKR